MGMLQTLKDKYIAYSENRENLANFRSALMDAVADGQLTDEEVESLADLRTQFGLSLEDIGRARVKAYEAAFRAAAADKAITTAEAAELTKIQKFLQLSDNDIAQTKQEFARYRLLAEIQRGNLPEPRVGSLILQKAETAHWIEPASLIEERVVGRRYEGSSSGMSFRIAKGVSYRVGASRGRLIVDTANVPVSVGELVLTNKRVIFRGDKKSFNYRLDKLLDIQLYSQGLRITDTNGKPRTLQFAREGNADVVGSILTHTINRYLEAG